MSTMNDIITNPDPGRPNRCQRTLPTGQCPNDVVPGLDRCEQHVPKSLTRRHTARNYEIRDVQAQLRVDALSGSDRLYDLDEEISVLRWSQRQNIEDMQSPDNMVRQLATNNFMATAQTLEKLIKTGASVKEKFGQLLSKEAVLALAERIMTILADEIAHIPDSVEIIDRVTSRIADEIQSARNPTKE